VVAWQIEQAMLKGNITKVEMAERMRNNAVTLLTLWHAAHAIGRELHIELALGVPRPQALYGLAAFSMLDGRCFKCGILNVNEGPAWTKMNGS
jgi:hypothetical protein